MHFCEILPEQRRTISEILLEESKGSFFCTFNVNKKSLSRGWWVRERTRVISISRKIQNTGWSLNNPGGYISEALSIIALEIKKYIYLNCMWWAHCMAFRIFQFFHRRFFLNLFLFPTFRISKADYMSWALVQASHLKSQGDSRKGPFLYILQWLRSFSSLHFFPRLFLSPFISSQQQQQRQGTHADVHEPSRSTLALYFTLCSWIKRVWSSVGNVGKKINESGGWTRPLSPSLSVYLQRLGFASATADYCRTACDANWLFAPISLSFVVFFFAAHQFEKEDGSKGMKKSQFDFFGELASRNSFRSQVPNGRVATIILISSS